MRTHSFKANGLWYFVAGILAMAPQIFWLFYLLIRSEEEQERLSHHNETLRGMYEYEVARYNTLSKMYDTVLDTIYTRKEGV